MGVKTYEVTGWVTLTGVNSQVIYQPEPEYVRMAGMQDFALYLEVANLTNTANTTNVDFQCGPTKDSTFLDGASQSANMYALSWALGAGFTAGVQTVKVCRFATAADQLPSEWGRYKIRFPAAGGPTNITMRMWMSALLIG
jgi:hypothetical protein